MRKFITKTLAFGLPCLMALAASAQTNIVQWNFNSNPPDASSTTGSTAPSIGSGTLTSIGGLTQSFASGAANGGSSDTASTDNTGLGLTAFPTQGNNNKTAGIQFSVSTVAYQNIKVTFDLRHSNTSSKVEQLQYTLDASATTPVWVDFDTATALAGDTWYNRSFNLSSITGLNNNAYAAFRVVSAFAPSTSAYAASGSTNSYLSSGTWRFDMVTVKGDSINPVSLPNLFITEVIHSPNNIEMIEVYNAGSSSVNLNGLYFTNGTSGNFPNQYLAAGATILFSTNPTSAASLMGGTYHLLGAGLGASSDILVIKNAANAVIDSVAYQVGTASWPSAPTGTYYGYSIELNGATLDNNVGSNWTATTQNIISSASGAIYATPGSYPPPAANPAPIVTSFSQLSATTTTVTFNQAVTSATATNTSNYVFNPSVSISNATLNGNTVTLTHSALSNGQPYTLAINGVQNAAAQNNVADTVDLIWNQSTPNLVITEIIHSPNTCEMIEVYNAGSTAIALGGLKWTDGTSGNFPIVTLAAGDNIVFSTEPISADTILNVTDSIYALGSGLSSSDDILVIRNSLNQVVDSVHYYVGTNNWPTAPTGIYAYSYELTSATANNNVGSNWTVPLNEVTPQPSVGIVRATPGVYPPPPVTSSSGLVNFVGSSKAVNENETELTIVANMIGGGPNPSSVDLQLLSMGTATDSVDYILPSSLQFNWPANANNVNDTITITIVNDTLAENAEFFVFELANPVNATLPAASANVFTGFILDDEKKAPVAKKNDFLTHITSFSNDTAGDNSAEIVAFDSASNRLYIANSIGGKIDIVNFQNPANPVWLSSIPVNPTYGNINSIAVHNGLVAAAVEDLVPENPGKVVFFDSNGVFINQVAVGAMPDMITFNHAGTKVLVANEGQPKSDYTEDPEGSVSIVDISGGAANVTISNVHTADFQAFNSQASSLKASGVRLFGLNNASVAQDMEPEYIAVAKNDSFAWVTCQENNAIAKIDLHAYTITEIFALGTKDHMQLANALDASDQGGKIVMANWPIKGVYMPDAIAAFKIGSQNYLITANEGDAREYDAYEEAVRVGSSSYVLDSTAFPNPAFIKNNLGRLNVTLASGDADGDGDYDEIHAFGARSFTIWNADNGSLVYDNGQDFELITSKDSTFKSIFNASNSNNNFKNRSDDKGPEPEGVVTAKIGSKTYAFIALERIGGCMVYDISNPAAPEFVDYKNTRTVSSYGGDNGSEGIIYIDSASSPDGKAYVILANEVSSTLSIFEVKAIPEPPVAIGKVNQSQFCYVHPNPTNGSVHLLVEGKVSNATITVMDLSGKVYQTLVTHSNNTVIDMHSYAAGTYIILFNDGMRQGSVKVIRQ